MKDDAVHDRFSAAQHRTLGSVLDEIIPPSSDGRLPGAGEVGLASTIDEVLRSMTPLRSMIAEGLEDLERQSRERHGKAFAALARDEKLQLLGQQSFVFPLTFQTFVAYYQHPRVAAALGLDTRPPHPEGYAMAPNDPALLEPVKRRPKLYREC